MNTQNTKPSFPYFEKLLQLIPPPDNVVYADNHKAIHGAEQQHGLVFPQDYKKLMATYGSGTFCNTLHFESPFGDNSLFDSHFRRSEYYNTMLKGFPAQAEQSRFSIFPEPGGLLGIGGDDNANVMMWKVEMDNDIWPLYFFDDYMLNESVYNVSITEFIYKWAIGAIKPACLETTIQVGTPIIPSKRYPLFRPTLSIPTQVCHSKES